MLSNLKAIALPFGRRSGILKFRKYALNSKGYIALLVGRNSGILKLHKYALKSKGYSFTFWQKIRNFEVSQLFSQI